MHDGPRDREGALRTRHAPSSIDTACASQNRMSMSRYIVVAVIRCPCAS